MGARADIAASTEPRRLLFGDSHVHAIQEAIRHRENAGQSAPVEARRLLKQKSKRGDPPFRSQQEATSQDDEGRSWFSRLKDPSAARHNGQSGAGDEGLSGNPVVTIGDTTFEEFLALAQSMGPDDILISAIGGNQHAVVSTIKHPRPFDFFLPGDEARTLDPDTELIPFRPMQEFFASGVRHRDGESLTALRAATRAKIIHLSAPPPKADNDFIKQYHDTQFASRGIAVTGVSTPELRLKFWRLQNRVLQEMCDELGIEMLPAPRAACDAAGFLAPHYYAKDATHANAAYGELVLAQLENCFDQTAAD